jgi:tetratricopeptide (TPR) repeat protein
MLRLSTSLRSSSAPGARLTGWVALALIVLTIAVFAPSMLNGFVDWDDEINLTRNLRYRGFSATHVHWILTNMLMGHYIPVTWTSFALDHAIWGMNPFGYHLTNVVLHAMNAALVFLIALRLLAHATAWPTGTLRLAAGVAALFFAVHPLRAESVAWVTERRDVLSGFFALLSVLGYLAAQGRSGRARQVRLVASVAAFGLALLSKSIVMGLPLVLLVLDVYPLRRITPTRSGLIAGWRVWLEKIPYAALGVAGAAISYYAVHSNDFFTSTDAYPWPARIAMAGYSFWFYVTTTLMPIGLSPLYELPASVSPLELRFLGPMVGVMAITAVSVLMRRRWPALLAAWACYLVLLGPVSGLVHAGYQLAHDRYSYLSCIGWALLVGAGVAALLRAGRRETIRPALATTGAGAVGVWLLALATLTWYQVQVWKDSESLWSHAVEMDDRCAICHGNLGVHLANQDKPHAGIPHIERALALRPERIRTHANLGVALLKLDRTADAIEQFRIVLAREPNHVDVLSALGVALMRDGRTDESLAHLQRAVTIDPMNVLARANYGTALAHAGLRTAALQEYRQAIALDPQSTAARYGLGWALARFGDRDAARAEVAMLQKLDASMATRLVREIEAGL